MNSIKNCFMGLYLMLQSPGFMFALICLGLLIWKAALVGSAAFVGFFGIVPALLIYCEHKETLANGANNVQK